MNRKTAQGLFAVALVYAAVLPAAAETDEPKSGFLCLIELPPNFSETRTGNEVETFDSQLTCAEGEIELVCETTLDRATLDALRIPRNRVRTLRHFPCRIEAHRCDDSLEAQLADDSKLIIRGATGRTTLECELEVPL